MSQKRFLTPFLPMASVANNKHLRFQCSKPPNPPMLRAESRHPKRLVLSTTAQSALDLRRDIFLHHAGEPIFPRFAW